MSVVNLNNLSDLQKTYLTQLSYLDINWLGVRKCEASGLKVKDIKAFLLNPDIPFCGAATMNKETFDKATAPLLGDYKMPTDTELADCIVELGLGDLIVTSAASDPQSGFQAISFKDCCGNVGISFRGSDLDFSNGGMRDWLEADFLEYFTNDSTQRRIALDFFNLHKNPNGNNYVYGHSLGGNLSSHVFAAYHDEIASVFIINGYPINQALLNSDEKIAAFNSDKYTFNSICGDIVSHLKSCELYQGRVRFIKNNGNIKPSLLSAHLVQSASFDDDGTLISITKDETMQNMGRMHGEFITLAQSIRESLNEVESKLEYSKIRMIGTKERYKEELLGKIETELSPKIEAAREAIDESRERFKEMKQKAHDKIIRSGIDTESDK